MLGEGERRRSSSGEGNVRLEKLRQGAVPLKHLICIDTSSGAYLSGTTKCGDMLD
jgi:hypothetical protein